MNVEAIRRSGVGRHERAGIRDRSHSGPRHRNGRQTPKVNFGFGYGSEEKARGEIDWRRVNFLGAARTAGVFARYSSLDRGVRLNLKQPYLFSPRYAATLSGQSWFGSEPASTSRRSADGYPLFGSSAGRELPSPAAERQTTTASVTYVNEWEE